MTTLRQAVASEMPRAIEDLKAYCGQPSVAAQNLGIADTVELVRRLFTEEGARVDVLENGGGNPILHVEFEGPSERTLLFYDHYDVQPPEPLEEWTTPPFQPVVRDGRLFARGSSDNKGDLICRLAAVRALKRVYGHVPCRVKFLIEGEEEVGSPTFAGSVERYKDRFQADACIWEFGMKDETERPLLYGGLKGICYLQFTVRTMDVDLHSSMAPIVHNPAWRLVWALASLKGPDGRVLIPGFYENAGGPTDRDLAYIERIPWDVAEFKRYHGIRELWQERGGRTLSVPEMVRDYLFEPTCTICGLEAGYAGPGTKTVLPREASAKVDFRLVGRMSPQEVLQKVRAHLDSLGYDDIQVESLGPEHPYQTSLENPFVDLVWQTAKEAYGKDPVLYPTAAGSGPMYPVGNILEVPIISTGCSYWGSGAHAPDENIRLEDFEQGAFHMALLLERFGTTSEERRRQG